MTHRCNFWFASSPPRQVYVRSLEETDWDLDLCADFLLGMHFQKQCLKEMREAGQSRGRFWAVIQLWQRCLSAVGDSRAGMALLRGEGVRPLSTLPPLGRVCDLVWSGFFDWGQILEQSSGGTLGPLMLPTAGDMSVPSWTGHGHIQQSGAPRHWPDDSIWSCKLGTTHC